MEHTLPHKLRVCLPEPRSSAELATRLEQAVCEATRLTPLKGGRFELSRKPLIVYHVSAFGDICAAAYWPRNCETGRRVLQLLGPHRTRTRMMDLLMAMAYNETDERDHHTLREYLGFERYSQLGHVKEYGNRREGVHHSQLDYTQLYMHVVSELSEQEDDDDEEEEEEDGTTESVTL